MEVMTINRCPYIYVLDSTSFFILEDAVLLFRTSPPTAKTGYRRYLIFGMDTHQVPTGGPTEAIFDIWPLSQVMGVGQLTPRGQKLGKIFFPIFLFFSIWLVRYECLLPEKPFLCAKKTFFSILHRF